MLVSAQVFQKHKMLQDLGGVEEQLLKLIQLSKCHFVSRRASQRVLNDAVCF